MGDLITLVVIFSTAGGAVLNFLLSIRAANDTSSRNESDVNDHAVDSSSHPSIELDSISRVRIELLAATTSTSVDILSNKPGRIVCRLNLPDSSTAIAKVALEATSRASAGLFVEAQTLSYLASWNLDVAPKLRHMTLLGEGSPCLIRDDAQGQDLHRHMARIADSGKWPRAIDALVILSSAARATASLHSCDVIHGDIKPANLVYSFRGDKSLRFDSGPSIIDFDCAQFAKNPPVIASAGTLGFCAPERYFASNPLKQSDVYSLGSIAIFLFTGRPGLSGTNPRVPEYLRGVVKMATDSLPFNRHENAEEFADSIDRIVNGLTPAEKREKLNWPKDWRSQIEPVLTQSIYFDKPLPNRESRVPRERVSVLSLVIDDLVKEVLKRPDQKFVEEFLNGDVSLQEFAKVRHMSTDVAYNRLNKSLMRVQKAVEKEMQSRVEAGE